MAKLNMDKGGSNSIDVMEKIIIKGFPVSQNGQDFIIGKAPIGEVLKYTRYTERLIIAYDEEEKPIYNKHVQRKVDGTRARQIANFLLNDKEAIFPTNIVLNIPINIIESQEEQNGIVSLTLIDDVAEQVEKARKEGNDKADIYVTIIDGQHRIRGIEVAIEILLRQIEKSNSSDEKEQLMGQLDDLLKMELVVSFFIDKDLEFQAMTFSTINRTQRRVSQDLVYELFGLTSEDSPQKTALEVALALNAHPKSPFYRRIKLYGGTYTKDDSRPLSQAAMIKSIIKGICSSVQSAETERYQKRSFFKFQNSVKRLPFRQFYADDRDDLISDCMFYYFNSVRRILGQYWNYDGHTKPQNILQSTVGYESLMSLLAEIMQRENIRSFEKNTFDAYVEKLKGFIFSDVETFPMTTRGKIILYYTMSLAVFPSDDPNDGRSCKLKELVQH